MTQLNLPFEYRCANPGCREVTYSAQLYCDDICDEAVERHRYGKSIFKGEGEIDVRQQRLRNALPWRR